VTGQGGSQLKEGLLRGCILKQVCDQQVKSLRGDGCPVNLKTLGITDKMRRGEQAGTIACPGKHGRKKGSSGTFTVGADNMNGGKITLWMSETAQKRRYPLKTGLDGKTSPPEQLCQPLGTGHAYCLVSMVRI